MPAGSFQSQEKSDREHNVHPSFQKKQVYCLECFYCESVVCRRGMKAILLADTKTELYSTDTPEKDAVDVTDEYLCKERLCNCQVENVACKTCGNVIGYHVHVPCRKCLQACNNGHYWMYHSRAVISVERLNETENKVLSWGEIPDVLEDFDNMYLKEDCGR